MMSVVKNLPALIIQTAYPFLTRLVSVCVLLALISPFVRAQSNVDNNITQSKEHIETLYKNAFGNQSLLNNGVTYKGITRQNYQEENKFFDSQDWLEADIVYDGQLFKGVFLKYDLVIDKVILEYPAVGELQLIDQLISNFVISGHKFTWLKDAGIEKGFYEIFFDGKIKLYEKHHKVFVKSIESQKVLLQYISRNQFYLLKDNTYSQVKSDASFYKIFDKTSRKAIKRYARTNGISIRREGRNAMVKLVVYYLSSSDE